MATFLPIFSFLFLLVATSLISTVNSTAIEKFSRQEKLHEKFHVQWTVNLKTKQVQFFTTVKTLGFVGFGISPNGGMKNADIVIGGVHSNGTAYFSDYHGVGNTAPVKDAKQDWTLVGAKQNETHTMLNFTRVFDTCDSNDRAFTNDTLHFIWAYGNSDEISYHSSNRGSSVVIMLDFEQPEKDMSKYMKASLTSTMTIPSASTTYWCSVHKGPELDKKHHVVAFEPKLPSAAAVRHTHHFVVYRCAIPNGENSTFFDEYVDGPGGNCHTDPSIQILKTKSCHTFLYVWGVGGKRLTFPEDTGYVIGETPDEYYMLEIHYDNPEKVENAHFETGVQFYYTDALRKHDLDILMLGTEIIPTLIVPPQTKDFTVSGHCAPQCTNRYPPEGLSVIAVFLHSHLLGRAIKVRQFRNGTELPWLASDATYQFDYQATRILPQEISILPGDQLTLECTYDSTGKDEPTMAGLTTNQEMCLAFLWYYLPNPPQNRVPYVTCSSFPKAEAVAKAVGIDKIKWGKKKDGMYTIYAQEPEPLTNKSIEEVIQSIDWTPELILNMHELQSTGPQISTCAENAIVGYPDVPVYKPKACTA